MNKKCKICGKAFIGRKEKSFCGYSCFHSYQKTLRFPNRRKPKPFSQLHKNNISAKLRGKPKSKEHIAKLSGENAHAWKGENVGYVALHDWVKKVLGAPNTCENCGTTEIRRYEWSNISGKYLRSINDWIRLCVKCHRKRDGNIPNRWYKKELPCNKDLYIKRPINL
jgi:hypothetical protein